MADVARLHKVLDRIKTLPRYDDDDIEQRFETGELPAGDGWYQADWLRTLGEVTITDQGLVDSQGEKTCGTAGCFAGWAVVMFAPDGTRVDGAYVTMPDGGTSFVSEMAQELLDLEDAQRRMLFAGSSTIFELERVIARIEAGE